MSNDSIVRKQLATTRRIIKVIDGKLDKTKDVKDRAKLIDKLETFISREAVLLETLGEE